MPLAAMVPISASLALPFEDSTVWSTMIEPPMQMGVAAGLLVLVEEVHGIGAAETEIDGIDVFRQKLGNVGGEVLGSERYPEPLGDLPAGFTIFNRQAP